jgi:dienelactone hydrolase
MTSPMLISQEVIATNLENTVARLVRHRSYDLRGRGTESSGLVMVPTTAGDNRRVMTWCHGTTGMGDAACPSAQPDPAGDLRTYFSADSTGQIDYGVPGVQKFIDDGWIVCATDYQGLGTPGMHQYTVNRTNAIDAVTIVHAAREMGLGAGTRFGTMGWSQGGAASAAMAELDDADFGELELVGSVAMSPGVPIMGMRDPSGLSTALTGADIPPDGHLIMILTALVTAFPDELNLGDVFTPLGIEIMEKAWNTQPVHHLSDTLGRMYSFEGPILDVKADRIPAWLAAMTEASAGRVTPRCPIFVAVDGFHGGSVVPVGWQTAYADAAKALGGDVTTKVYENDDHFSLPGHCVADAREWLTTQF